MIFDESVRWQRTGEWRIPLIGEWFESPRASVPVKAAPPVGAWPECWILVPNHATAPRPRNPVAADAAEFLGKWRPSMAGSSVKLVERMIAEIDRLEAQK